MADQVKKLDSLTPEQIEKIDEVKNFWLNRILKCENTLNKEEAKKGVEWLYEFCGKEKPLVVFQESPMGCQIAVNYYKSVWKEGVPLKEVSNDVIQAYHEKVGKFQYEQFSWYANVSDYGWVAHIDFFMQIGMIELDPNFENFKNLLLSNVFDMIQMEGLCVVSDLPSKISRNEAGRLHNPTGSAVEFRDGYKQYYINGRAVPAWVFEKAEKGEITKELFLNEKNTDIKGAIYEILGQIKMMELLGAEPVDEQTLLHHIKKMDEEGNVIGEYDEIEVITLLKTKETFEEIDNQPFCFVKMECPSTGTTYLQGVEPHFTDARAAIASLSLLSAEDYSWTMRS